MQLIEMDIPMVMALNMMDEVREQRQNSIEIHEDFQECLGVPVVPISAAKNEGIDDAYRASCRYSGNKTAAQKNRLLLRRGSPCYSRHSPHYRGPCTKKSDVSPRFAAIKLIEGDEPHDKNAEA